MEEAEVGRLDAYALGARRAKVKQTQKNVRGMSMWRMAAGGRGGSVGYGSRATEAMEAMEAMEARG